jgi:hypothetical protein
VTGEPGAPAVVPIDVTLVVLVGSVIPGIAPVEPAVEPAVEPLVTGFAADVEPAVGTVTVFTGIAEFIDVTG